MQNAKDLLNYKKELAQAIKDGDDTIFFNDSILHTMLIVKELLNKASKEDGRLLQMYCGNFSLFRDKTERKVLDEKYKWSTTDLSKEESENWASLDFYADLQQALTDFLSVEGKLKLILQYQTNTLPENRVWRVLENGIRQNNVSIYQLKINVGLDHFAVTREAYRVENSNEIKTATCCFKDSPNANILNENFNELIKFSEPFIV